MTDGGRNDKVVLSRAPSTALVDGPTYDNLEQTVNEVSYLVSVICRKPFSSVSIRLFHGSLNRCFGENNTGYVSI